MDTRRKSDIAWVVIGYVLSLFAGIPGMIVGAIIMSAKRKLTEGGSVHLFDERVRKHGKIILYLGSSILIISILFFINWFMLEKVFFGRPLNK